MASIKNSTGSVGGRSLLARQLLQKEADPIVIIGVGCRFPGRSSDLESFEQMLESGFDAVSEMPWERVDGAEMPTDSNAVVPNLGTFVHNFDQFDAPFFGIAVAEAVNMDPQQRVLLEVTWQAFENAGINVKELSGSNTGVFIGIAYSEYEHLRIGQPLNVYSTTGTAVSVAAGRLSYVLDFWGPCFSLDTVCSSSVVSIYAASQALLSGDCEVAIAGGVNSVLNPRRNLDLAQIGAISPTGRCKTFDTTADGYMRGEGCGILVLKRLSHARRDGNQILAIVRGIAVNHDGHSQGLTAPNGSSQQAVIRKAQGLAGVSPDKIEIIEAHGTGTALGDPQELFALGAVFEERIQEDAKRIGVGSAKTVIGHLVSAAGVGGVTKTALALKNETVFSHLNLSELNFHLDPWNLPFAIVSHVSPWVNETALGNLAGVSAFGLSGTNAHAILGRHRLLEDLPVIENNAVVVDKLLGISARSEQSLTNLVAQYVGYLVKHPEQRFADVAMTSVLGREHFNVRISLFATIAQDAVNQLKLWQKSGTLSDETANKATNEVLKQYQDNLEGNKEAVSSYYKGKSCNLVVGLPSYPFERKRYWIEKTTDSDVAGHGFDNLHNISVDYQELWNAIKRKGESAAEGLLSTFSLEREVARLNVVNRNAAYFMLGLYSDEPKFSSDKLRQTFSDIGINPRYRQLYNRCTSELSRLFSGQTVIDREALRKTVNEDIARLNLQDDARIKLTERCGDKFVSVLRGKENPRDVIFPEGSLELVSKIYEQDNIAEYLGCITQEIISELISKVPERSLLRVLEIGAGTGGTKSRILSLFPADRTEYKFTDTSPIFLRRARDKYKEFPFLQYELLDIEKDPTEQGFKDQSVDLIVAANVLHATKDINDTLEYTSRLLAPGGILVLLEVTRYFLGFDIIFGMLLQELQDETTRDGQPFLTVDMWDSLLKVHGFSDHFRSSQLGQHVVLAQKKVDASASRNQAFTSLKSVSYRSNERRPALPAYSQEISHELLGRKIASPVLQQTIYETQLSLERISYLQDHKVYGHAVFPGAGYVELSLAAMQDAGLIDEFELCDLAFEQALTFEKDKEVTVQTIIEYDKERVESKLGIYSYVATDTQNLTWKKHFEAKIKRRLRNEIQQSWWRDVQNMCSESLDVSKYYDYLSARGNFYGTVFRGIREIRRGEKMVFGQLEISETLADSSNYVIHPTLLDAAFQMRSAPLFRAGNAAADIQESFAYMPIGIEHVTIYRRPVARNVFVAIRIREERFTENNEVETVLSDVFIFDENGPFVAINGLLAKRISQETLERALKNEDEVERVLYDFLWQRRPWVTVEKENEIGHWLIVSEFESSKSLKILEAKITEGTCKTINRDEGLEWLSELGDWMNAFSGDISKRGIVYVTETRSDAITFSTDELGARIRKNCEPFLQCAKELLRETGISFWLVTEGVQEITRREGSISILQAPLWGMARTLRNEKRDSLVTIIDLDPDHKDDISWVDDVLKGVPGEDIAYRDGDRYVARLSRWGDRSRLQIPINNSYTVFSEEVGNLDRLTIRKKQRIKPQKDEVEVQVLSTGINFRDVMQILGMKVGELGAIGQFTEGDFSGVIVDCGEGVSGFTIGDVVFGNGFGCFSSHVTVSQHLIAKVPPNIDVDQAAAIPGIFLTAYYALQDIAKLKQGETILIHAGAGGVGLAAIYLAKKMGATIFATAGSEKKRAYLKKLGVQHVFDSRTLKFAEEILQITKGRGVDVVLNSLAGEFIAKSVDVLAKKGRFLEIGKTGIWTHDQFQKVKEGQGCRYDVIKIDQMIKDTPEFIGGMLQRIANDLNNEISFPIPIQRFHFSEIKNAFRYIQGAKQIGKVVLVHPHKAPLSYRLSGHGSYLIVGGLNGLGLFTAKWLVENGVRNLVLMGRSAPGEEARSVLADVSAQEVNVVTVQGDVSVAIDVKRAINAAGQHAFPRLKGVIHSALVLDDGSFEGQTWERFHRVMASKVMGTWNLFLETRDKGLDFFVMFSSMASAWGNPGQSNYAAAGAFEDTFAYYLRSHGMPAYVINFGAVGEIGAVARFAKGKQEHLKSQGSQLLDPKLIPECFEKILLSNRTQTGVADIDWGRFSRIAPLANDLLKARTAKNANNTNAETNSNNKLNLIQSLSELDSETRLSKIKAIVLGEIQTVLGFDAQTSLRQDQPLKDIGIDSLMAVELRNRLSTSFQTSLPSTLIFDYPSLSAIVGFLDEKIGSTAKTNSKDLDVKVSPAKTASSQDKLSAIFELIEQLSEAETQKLVEAFVS